MDLCRLADVLVEKETIFPMREVPLDDLVVFSNSDTTYTTPAFRARNAKSDSIDVGRLPRGTTLHGSHLFAACVGNSWIVETVPPYLQEQMRLTPPDPPTEKIPIQDECFIAACYGHGTWGHWLGEILPLVALAERVYPGRFRYATTFYGGDGASYDSRVAESFAAYGISENRLFRMMANRSYTFSSAHWITPAWSDHILHPDVATVMRGAVHLDPLSEHERIALPRRGARGRALVNPEGIADLLRDYGYVPRGHRKFLVPHASVDVPSRQKHLFNSWLGPHGPDLFARLRNRRKRSSSAMARSLLPSANAIATRQVGRYFRTNLWRQSDGGFFCCLGRGGRICPAGSALLPSPQIKPTANQRPTAFTTIDESVPGSSSGTVREGCAIHD
jgi:hypothetical protein